MPHTRDEPCRFCFGIQVAASLENTLCNAYPGGSHTHVLQCFAFEISVSESMISSFVYPFVLSAAYAILLNHSENSPQPGGTSGATRSTYNRLSRHASMVHEKNAVSLLCYSLTGFPLILHSSSDSGTVRGGLESHI